MLKKFDSGRFAVAVVIILFAVATNVLTSAIVMITYLILATPLYIYVYALDL